MDTFRKKRNHSESLDQKQQFDERRINMKIIKIIVAASCLALSSAYATETTCQNLQLGENDAVYVGIKRYDGAPKVGDRSMITIMSPTSTYWRELTNLTLEVTSLKLLEKSSTYSTYAVKFKFPHNSNIAERYNDGVKESYSICKVYP